MFVLDENLKPFSEAFGPNIPKDANQSYDHLSKSKGNGTTELHGQAVSGGHCLNGPRGIANSLTRIGKRFQNRLLRAVPSTQQAVLEPSNPDAMHTLGLTLMTGAGGMDRDVNRAVKLYERAINEHAFPPATVNLARVLMVGADRLERDVNQA